MTEQYCKTKDIALRLQISPATVLKWVKKYRIPYTVNASGHYCFAEDTVPEFLKIKNQHQQEGSRAVENSEHVSRSVMLDRLAQTEENVQILERMIMNKADDIVTFQMVEQRRKIEALTKKMDKLEKQMEEQGRAPRRKQEEAAGMPYSNHPPAGLFQFE
ncbi:hypothetical protein [Salibacterium qingdaonense]|uniref:Chromosome-anchoring protein RacA n=1 Tax=Salibacterium qingdaonense TaxID=266892 RepID=A0A1I4JYT6_9BACI|nr:hypothetical protein [Salibacterium qingdaonense]SFL71758.1 hypothetical protein SAMN04488054_10420 [Salibacterium qingdaonense]